MYNARAFFIADVLVHVGAPVGETAFRSKRYTLCLPLRPSVSLSHMRPFFVFCPLFLSLLSASPPFLFLPSSSRRLNLSFPLLSFHSLVPSPSVPRYRPTSTYTAYSNEPRIVRCISGTNWILKIKKRRPKKAPRLADPPKPAVALHVSASASLVLFRRARSDPSLAARASSSSPLMLTSSSYRSYL